MEYLRHVRPIRPPAAYIGGKRQLAKTLVPMIEAIPHTTYAEPFLGMGGIFFRRQRVPRAEVVNDFSRDVTTLFRILQRHYPQFMDELRFGITSRAEFQRLLAADPSTLTDLERAARFLYLQRTVFGGKVNGKTFGVSPLDPGRFDVTKLAPLLDAIHDRLAGVVIECLSYVDFIPRYDRPEVLFYLDPPYWGCERDYGPDTFSRDDFERLAGLLRGLKGKFILSLNDTEPVRRIFEGFEILPVGLTYTITRGKAVEAREVIISNVPLIQAHQAA